MSRLLCCLRARPSDMGGQLSHPQEGEACEAGVTTTPPTMADVIRERKKKAGGAGLGTLRRRLVNVTRRPNNRHDRGCSDARYIRSVVSSWSLPEVFLLCEELEAGAALRDLVTQAELAREPAPALPAALPRMLADRWWCDVELVGEGWSVWGHRAILAARASTLREILARYPPSCSRVTLEGCAASLTRGEAESCLVAIYSGICAEKNCLMHSKYENEDHVDSGLDIINGDNSPRCGCRSGRRALRAWGVSGDPLQTSMRYLLDSGELADASLAFRAEEAGGARYGFRAEGALRCHRALLAARSRYFRSLLSRSASHATVCIDERVLPRRYIRALLFAAYTDQVDLSLIGRNSDSPSSTNGGSPAWLEVNKGNCKPTTAMLDDAFQLYEIARFVEMPIVVQGCEDAIVQSLSPQTLAHVLRWCSQPHASSWVLRQAQRYLRDEFVSIVSSPEAGALPRAALAEALASPFLQASEPAALRALLRWAGARGSRRRRAPPDAAARALLAPLLAHVRLEHLAPGDELLQQLARRGVPAPAAPAQGSAAAWLGRAGRPARCLQPYLDELKALLDGRRLPDAELARARREHAVRRIPDTLYMVASGRPPRAASPPGAAAASLPPRWARAARARLRELRAAPAARAAAARAPHARSAIHTQLALRAVREMSLPDSCADLLLHDMEDDTSQSSQQDWPSDPPEEGEKPWPDENCCRTSRVEPNRCMSLPDSSRAGTCSRRDQSAITNSGSAGAAPRSRLPDVALAPNANTHLLTATDYFRHWEYGGVVLQLDLGDGATHTPRPGSRAQRNSAAQQNVRQREQAQAMSCLRSRTDEEEIRAAIEMSVMRAYSACERRPATTLPHPHPHDSASMSPRLRQSPRVEPTPHSSLRLSPSPSRRRREFSRLQDYRLEGSYGSSSRGHSPNNYA